MFIDIFLRSYHIWMFDNNGDDDKKIVEVWYNIFIDVL